MLEGYDPDKYILDIFPDIEKRIDQIKMQIEIQKQFTEQSKKMNLVAGLLIGCLILTFLTVVLNFS